MSATISQKFIIVIWIHFLICIKKIYRSGHTSQSWQAVSGGTLAFNAVTGGRWESGAIRNTDFARWWLANSFSADQNAYMDYSWQGSIVSGGFVL